MQTCKQAECLITSSCTFCSRITSWRYGSPGTTPCCEAKMYRQGDLLSPSSGQSSTLQVKMTGSS